MLPHPAAVCLDGAPGTRQLQLAVSLGGTIGLVVPGPVPPLPPLPPASAAGGASAVLGASGADASIVVASGIAPVSEERASGAVASGRPASLLASTPASRDDASGAALSTVPPPSVVGPPPSGVVASVVVPPSSTTVRQVLGVVITPTAIHAHLMVALFASE